MYKILEAEDTATAVLPLDTVPEGGPLRIWAIPGQDGVVEERSEVCRQAVEAVHPDDTQEHVPYKKGQQE